MIALISAVLLALVACLALALQRLYSVIPPKELKRLARRGDSLAKGLYRVAAHGERARLFLWVVAVGGFSGSILLFVLNMAAPIAFVLLSVVLMTAFILLPSLRLTQTTARLAVVASPAVAWLVTCLHAPLEIIARWIAGIRTLTHHSRLYEKDDLLGLLEIQKEQSGNRISETDLNLVQRALLFDDKKAADIMRSRATANLVDADETIGPLLLDRLHKQGQGSFLVYKDAKESIVGSLSMTDAVGAKHGGRVLDLVKGDLVFVHEDFTLYEVLVALQKTGQHLVVVINSFEEFVGIITLEAILSELLGVNESKDRPAYENRSVIAGWTPAPVLVPQQVDKPQNDSPDQSDEVVESSTNS